MNEIREAQSDSSDIRELFLKDLNEKEHEGFSAGHAKVLILSTQGDLESDLIGLILLSKGVDYLRINVEDISNNIQITIQGDRDFKITVKNQVVNLSDIQVVFVRRFDDNNINFESDTAFINKFVREQWVHMFKIIKESTSAARWVSRFDVIGGFPITKQYSYQLQNLLARLKFLIRLLQIILRKQEFFTTIMVEI